MASKGSDARTAAWLRGKDVALDMWWSASLNMGEPLRERPRTPPKVTSSNRRFQPEGWVRIRRIYRGSL